MYQELYQFLLLQKQLHVPGIGTLLLERKPATIDFPNKKIDPPVYLVVFEPLTGSPSKKLFAWLSQVLHISNQEAVIRFNEFASGLKKQLVDGDIINWNGVGTISKGLGADVKFTAADPLALESPVPAEKVIRDKAEHMVRVGEEERTSVEMTEMLNRQEVKKSYWWVVAAATALVAVMFTGWYFSEHGLDVSSTGNAARLVPQEATAPYKIIP